MLYLAYCDPHSPKFTIRQFDKLTASKLNGGFWREISSFEKINKENFTAAKWLQVNIFILCRLDGFVLINIFVASSPL